MPIEISEIGIRLAVGEPAAPVQRQAADDSPVPADFAPEALDEIVRRCVAEVLEALRLQGGR